MGQASKPRLGIWGPASFLLSGSRPADGRGARWLHHPRGQDRPPCFRSSLSSLSCPSRLILRIQIPHENTPHPWLTLMEFSPILAT